MCINIQLFINSQLLTPKIRCNSQKVLPVENSEHFQEKGIAYKKQKNL